MKKIFIDTNLFLRYLVNDTPKMADQVEQLLDEAEKGKVLLLTGPPVFFELAWTLKSFYKKSRQEIHECLSSILSIRGLKVSDGTILEQALALYRDTSADFSDAYIAALSKVLKTDFLATFNQKHFKYLGVNVYHFE